MKTDVAEIELQKVVKDLKDNYHKLGLKASGEYEEALWGEIKKNGDVTELIVWGAPHGHYMEHGRGKTTNAGGGVPLIDLIKEWIRVKGLTLNPYAVTKKIHNEGIKVPNKYNRGKVISDVINNDRIREIKDKVSSGIIEKAYSNVLNKF